MVEKIINHVLLTVSARIKCIDMTAGKPLLNKDESSLGRKCLWNYRSVVGKLSRIQLSALPYISMALHQCAKFCNNPHLLHELSVRHITKYLVGVSTYDRVQPKISLTISLSGIY